MKNLFVSDCFLYIILDAPNVTVNVSESEPTENDTLEIVCQADGHPSTYKYSPIVQSWNGIDIRRETVTGNGFIRVSRVQLQDSGTYTCMVNNGISDRNQQLEQIGKQNISIKGFHLEIFFMLLHQSFV